MKDIYKALTIAAASPILIIVIMIISSFAFTYASTEYMNVGQMKTPVVGLFMRWDSEYYLNISQSGYPQGYPNATTFPTSTSSESPHAFKNSQSCLGVLSTVPCIDSDFRKGSNAASQPNFVINSFRRNHK